MVNKLQRRAFGFITLFLIIGLFAAFYPTSGFERGELIAVMSLKDELVCLGKSIMTSKDIIKKDEGLAIKTEKVFMDRNTYS